MVGKTRPITYTCFFSPALFICVDLREEADHSEELWNLGEVPIEDRLPQHVQGIQGCHLERCRRADVSGQGSGLPYMAFTS